MNEIKCPHCGKMFTVDESGYTAIAQQIRDHEFNIELERRAKQLEEAKAAEIKLAKSDADAQIMALKEELKSADIRLDLAVTKAVSEKERELAVKKEELVSQKENFENILKNKDELIAYYKDLKIKQSTKMLGETLEQHCEIEFNKLRATAFRNAYFEKDNDSKSGSKGDYIYRESTEEGVEFISIMFEMKNEADETATKHKNEDFFKKLDKDRNEKGCEYAVLVSMLESENELYNQGIVDVSYQYPKMYVIRPQLFIPMITLLRNAALNSVKYKSELALIQNQNLDITHFEEDLNEFKEKFGRNVKLAGERFSKAIAEIDKTIEHLEKVKEHLQMSEKNLELADDKLEDLTIKKLTRNNPTMKERFESLKQGD